MKTLVPVLVGGLLVVATMPGEGGDGKEQEKLEGKWKMTSKQPIAGVGHTFEFYSYFISTAVPFKI